VRVLAGVIPVTEWARSGTLGFAEPCRKPRREHLLKIMWLKGIDSRNVTEVGASLAETFVTAAPSGKSGKTGQFKSPGPQLQAFMAQVDREVAPLQLGMFRRVRLANSFKWRLLDAGFEQAVADELTQMLLVRLSRKSAALQVADEERFSTLSTGESSGDVETLFSQAEACSARNAHDEAAQKYQQVLHLKPRHLLARNNLGVTLCKLGRYREAEEQYRQAAGIQPKYPDAQFNLGTLLRETGQLAESELPLRRAVKLNPRHADSQVSLGLTFLMMGRLSEARECFERALKIAPRHAGGLCGLGMIANREGSFGDAVALFNRALVFDSRSPDAWAGLARARKMTSADSDWLRGAEKAASSGLPPAAEAGLRFAIGKYCDDVGNYEKAFQSYERANRLQKTLVPKYNREARTQFVDEMIRVYPRGVFSTTASSDRGATLPVFVTGMMRSGTSLVEQIIASHPDARGAGELQFWADAMRKHADVVRNRLLDASLRNKLAERYLSTLRGQFPGATRVVDKTTFNSDFLGPIHSVLPSARIIYVRRDPIDTCLSCYFQQFSGAHSFTFDLDDLAHYYREHRRLVDHWRSVLPSGALLELHYADMVEQKEKWTRRILEFIGLEWDERCLEFHTASRPVLTASFWQVRQQMYNNSLARWRNYEKFIGPLRNLQDLRS
jgi:tetratricopeptide (TPR) repeat protein